MTKSEAMGKEMTDILNKGFKAMHMPFQADYYAYSERRGVRITPTSPLPVPAGFEYRYKATASAYENLTGFRDMLQQMELNTESTDMKNIGSYSTYLIDTVDVCGAYAADKERNKDVFKNHYAQWKRVLVDGMCRSLKDTSRLAKDIGISTTEMVKMSKMAQKRFQDDIKQMTSQTGR